MKKKKTLKITDKFRLDWLEGRSVRAAWKTNSIPQVLYFEPGSDIRTVIDYVIREDER